MGRFRGIQRQNEELKRKYKKLEKKHEELLERYRELEQKHEEVLRKLSFYENPHTPPSKDERNSRANFVSKTGLGVGKKTGYNGRTRERKEPTHFVNSFCGVCPKCGKRNNPKEVKEKVYEEIPEPQPIRVVKAFWGYYECECGHCFESRHPDVPEVGIIGKNAQTHITLLKFADRLPLRKVVKSLDREFGLELTSKTIYDVTKRVAEKATPEYEKILYRIRESEHLHIDETEIKVQGETYYVWIFRSRTGVFYVIRKSRERKVLDEVLGYDYKGIIIADGWRAYKSYTEYLQRCWAHILRETRELAEKHDDARPMHNWMKRLFEKVKGVKPENPLDDRQKLYDACIKDMKQLVCVYSSYRHLRKIVTKIENGSPYWFTRIMHPEIEPTNNNAEQPLREIVVIKKIIGTLRNTDGASILERIMTLLQTWELNGINQFTALRTLI